ncbi:hypothetical protein ACFY0A_43770 [Streptomyces sp. NPDC001698]|uniref:hypothetical protein n=1 Tax=unclassified Streptomyces TaxID=2593676 RepID=UPI0036D0274C
MLTRYRMATTEQMHLTLTPRVRIEQTRRRLAKLCAEGLVVTATRAAHCQFMGRPGRPRRAVAL